MFVRLCSIWYLDSNNRSKVLGYSLLCYIEIKGSFYGCDIFIIKDIWGKILLF